MCVVTGHVLHPGSELWSCRPEKHQNHCGLRHTPGRALSHHYSLFSFLPAFSQHFPIFVCIIFFSFSPFTSFSSFQGMPGPLLNFYMTKEQQVHSIWLQFPSLETLVIIPLFRLVRRMRHCTERAIILILTQCGHPLLASPRGH